MGILDLLTQPAQSFYGLLNGSGSDNAALNSVPGYSMRAPDDPFADLDKKQKEEAEKKAAAGAFVNGAPAIPQAGVSGQMAMQPGPFGALAPMAPQAAPAAAPQPPVPTPQPSPIPAPPIPVPPSTPIDQTTLPANATPTQGQLPTAPAQPDPSIGDQVGGMFSKAKNYIDSHQATMLALAGGLAGAPSLGQGLGRGFTAAAAALPADQKLAMTNVSNTAMLRAFQDAKVPPALAMAALNDPALRQKVFDNYLADRKGELKDITVNGTKMSVLHNPYDTKNPVTDLQGKPIDLGNLPGAVDPKLTGDDAYQAALTANPKLAAKALALKEGREVWPVGRAVTAGDNQQAMDLARQMDPSLTEANATLRHQTITDYGPKGKTGYARTAASTLLGHADQYDKLIDQQGNNDVGGPLGNHVRDYIKTTMGTDKKYLDTKGAMGELRTGIANEMEKALAGRVSVQGIKDILGPLDQAKGPTEQHAAIRGIIHMLGTRLDEMSNNFDSSMNTRTQGFHMLSPKAREIFKQYGGQVSGDVAPAAIPGIADPSAVQPSSAPPAQATSAVPTATGPNGHKIVVQNGRWVDAQTGQPVQ